MMKILTADAETASNTRRSEISEDLIVEAVQADLTNYNLSYNLYKVRSVPSLIHICWVIDIIHGTWTFIKKCLNVGK